MTGWDSGFLTTTSLWGDPEDDVQMEGEEDAEPEGDEVQEVDNEG
jgi:hypothetical protein